MDGRNHLLICTLGGSPEPLVASIRHWKPARVLFLPSDDTRKDVETIIQVPGLLVPGTWDVMVVGDAQDFNQCVRRMRSLDETVRIWREKGPAYDVIVDFTGGTKCMSAALSVTSRGWPCQFSYVGGTERTKDGTGIVVSGKERMLVAQNPWNALGYQAIADASLLFDQHAFTPAVRLLEQARRAADDESIKRILSTFHQLCEGYGLWDRFQHKDALVRIEHVLKNATDLQVALGEIRFETVIRDIKENERSLRRIMEKPRSRAMVADLLANANRRKREARYDDGVARLYRAIESLAQLALAERHGISDTGKMDLDRVPESLRERWRGRAESGKLRLGLQDDYELLDALGDETGKAFKEFELHEHERSPLTSRNQSILAHGFEPVREVVFIRLWDSAIRLGSFSEDELPVFPCLAKPDGSW